MKVENMTSSRGNKIANQFLIRTDKGVYFQSYGLIIAFKPHTDGKIKLDKRYWEYSQTTGKYRNQFLGMDKTETEEAIRRGEIELVNLN